MTELIQEIGGSLIELEPVMKGSKNPKLISYSIWLSQGSKEDPREYLIPLHEVDKYIEALIKARDRAEHLLS